MRPDTVLISKSPGEIRIALLAGDTVIQVAHERSGDNPVEGAVFAGRVTKINRDLNAAFVDLGGDAPGFLAAGDARLGRQDRIKSIASVLREGDKVLVQADREAMDGKGPRLTCRLTLPGRYLNLQLGGEGLKFSRFLAKAERAQLQGLEEFLPGDAGLTFNPAVGGAKPDDLEAELFRLMDLRSSLYENFEAVSKAPKTLLPASSALGRVVGLCAPRSRIIVDDPSVGAAVCAVDRGLEFTTWSETQPLFEAYGVEEALEAALSAGVPLPGGGRILISETPALIAIDVDTGRATEGAPQRLAAKTNRAAVTAIAREIRLRNLSGQILIDFLAMKGKKDGLEILAQLRNALSGDPVESHVLGFTSLGLVELTRRRRGPSLGGYLGEPVDWAPSPETAALAALRQAAMARGGRIRLKAAPAVIDVLSGPLKDAVAETNQRLGGALTLEADATLAPIGFDIGDS